MHSLLVSFSVKSDNLHLNRIATASAFAIRFKCKSFPLAGNDLSDEQWQEPAGEFLRRSRRRGAFEPV